MAECALARTSLLRNSHSEQRLEPGGLNVERVPVLLCGDRCPAYPFTAARLETRISL